MSGMVFFCYAMCVLVGDPGAGVALPRLTDLCGRSCSGRAKAPPIREREKGGCCGLGVVGLLLDCTAGESGAAFGSRQSTVSTSKPCKLSEWGQSLLYEMCECKSFLFSFPLLFSLKFSTFFSPSFPQKG